MSHTTLYQRIAGRASRHSIIANSYKLTNSKESAIVTYIIDLDIRIFPPRLSVIEDIANLLLAIQNASNTLEL